ncbi:MAG TPA: DUF397 domain-containing protein [Mycobacteriales bacterium]|nr:DUF397 domain-containing protein [Mycobacteriales bacterium]
MSNLPQDALLWRKSTASSASGCVEVAAGGGAIFVRDSKAPTGPTLAFSTIEWTAFLSGVHSGEFSLEALDIS